MLDIALTKLLHKNFSDGGFVECRVPISKVEGRRGALDVIDWLENVLPADARFVGMFQSAEGTDVCIRFQSVDFESGKIQIIDYSSDPAAAYLAQHEK